MLQLMGRLSETQIEPSIEAQALVKTAMHLRVVVNFVKVCYTAQLMCFVTQMRLAAHYVRFTNPQMIGMLFCT